MVLCVVEIGCKLHAGTAVVLSGNEGHQSTDCQISRLTCEEIALQLTASVGCCCLCLEKGGAVD